MSYRDYHDIQKENFIQERNRQDTIGDGNDLFTMRVNVVFTNAVLRRAMCFVLSASYKEMGII